MKILNEMFRCILRLVWVDSRQSTPRHSLQDKNQQNGCSNCWLSHSGSINAREGVALAM